MVDAISDEPRTAETLGSYAGPRHIGHGNMNLIVTNIVRIDRRGFSVKRA